MNLFLDVIAPGTYRGTYFTQELIWTVPVVLVIIVVVIVAAIFVRRRKKK